MSLHLNILALLVPLSSVAELFEAGLVGQVHRLSVFDHQLQLVQLVMQAVDSAVSVFKRSPELSDLSAKVLDLRAS
ncbi:hypothetical protein FN846DRAFT_937152 [Sphaerosporella brunnea]|uniref:Fungal N-terminal domain-containing protein n=1 Tax=Sphaerosporella brunnea TaxID=1250544 RepID=A0A5J5F422_9PEZI|nr:hypothetical protein FN846DRAFT_937152 [Sphaerosporella brunnea]